MKVILPHSQSPMFLNPREKRSRQVLLCKAQGQMPLKNIWHQAIKRLKPEIVIDVGVNYGEFIFGERYPDSKRVIGIEANASLKPWLEQSREQHPDKSKIQIEIAIAAESSGDSRSFFVNAQSSGRSSAVKRSTDDWSEQEAQTIAIDDLVTDLDLPNSTVVFKIDVEGYEPKVMSGMTKLVAQSKDVLGLIEFNSTFIGQTGANPEEYLSYLKNHFSIVALPHKSEYKVLEEVSLDVLSDITGNKEVELDLALLSNKNLIHVLEKASEQRNQPLQKS